MNAGVILPFWEADLGASFDMTLTNLREFLDRCRDGSPSPRAFGLLARPKHMNYVNYREHPLGDAMAFILEFVEGPLRGNEVRRTPLGALRVEGQRGGTRVTLLCSASLASWLRKSAVEIVKHFAREARGHNILVTEVPLATDSRRDYVIAATLCDILTVIPAFNEEYASFGYWIESPKEPPQENRAFFVLLRTDGPNLQSYLARYGRWEVAVWDCLMIGERTRITISAPDLTERDNYWTYVTNFIHFLGTFDMSSDVVPESALPRLEIFVDDIDSFAKVRAVDAREVMHAVPVDLSEDAIQQAIESVLGEPYHQKDWGGEQNDLFTSRLRLGGRRITAAFLLKGKGTAGPLTISKCGKNGDQIERLTEEDADLYIIQHVGEIDQRVRANLRGKVELFSRRGRRCQMCIIDGVDLARLLSAYGWYTITN
jgi:hypothetical protein